jgi:arginine decarboxylase-like protein
LVTGAYQEILSMKHNLFDKPTDIIVSCDRSGFKIKTITSSSSIANTFGTLGLCTIYDWLVKAGILKEECLDCNDITK